MTLTRSGRSDEAWTTLQTLDSVHSGAVNFDLALATSAIREGDFATGDDRLWRLLREGNASAREQAVWYLVISLRNQGRLREALAMTARISYQLPRSIVLHELGRTAEAAKSFEAQVGFSDTDPFPGHKAKHRTWMLTHVATSLAAGGDTVRLAQLADSVEQLGKLSAFGRDPRLHHYIRGLLWNARKQPARAATAFRSSIWSWSEGYTRGNYELARTLTALKLPRQALYPLQTALRGDIESSNLYVSRTELHELLAQTFDALGQRDSAAVHYQRVVDAWRAADPALTARRNAAQLRLAAVSQP
jgi:tetratricopeptide (TPR) repeat protein